MIELEIIDSAPETKEHIAKVFGGVLKPQPQKLFRKEPVHGCSRCQVVPRHFQVLRNSGLTVGGNHV